MALLEREAIRFAESLDDYEHVTVKEIGGEEPSSYWLAVTDERFDSTFEIASHCDYWDFVTALVHHSRYYGKVRKEAA